MSLSNADQWTIAVAVTSALIASVGTIFGGYQALLMRETLVAGRVVALKDRQIGHCESLLSAFQKFQHFYEAENVRQAKMKLLVSAQGAVDAPEADLRAVGERFIEELEKLRTAPLTLASEEVASAAELLSIYSSDDTSRTLETVKSAAFMAGFGTNLAAAWTVTQPDGSSNFPSGTPADHYEEMMGAMDRLENRCRLVALGNLEGLL